MTDTLADHLNQRGVDSAHVEHAVRFLIGQWANYKSPDDMTTDLIEAGVASDALYAATAALTDDPELLDQAALDILSAAWNDPDLHAAAQASIDEASTRLPVIETGAIVVAAMYGLWLLTTRGRRSTTRTVRRRADGTYEQTETTEWYDPAGPLRAVVDLIRPVPSDALPDPAAAPPLPEASHTDDTTA